MKTVLFGCLVLRRKQKQASDTSGGQSRHLCLILRGPGIDTLHYVSKSFHLFAYVLVLLAIYYVIKKHLNHPFYSPLQMKAKQLRNTINA